MEVGRWTPAEIRIKRLIKKSLTPKTMTQQAHKPQRTILYQAFLPQVSHQSLNQILRLLRPYKLRPRKLCPQKLCPYKLRPYKLRPYKHRLHKLRPCKLRPYKLRPCKLRPHKLRPRKLRPRKLR